MKIRLLLPLFLLSSFSLRSAAQDTNKVFTTDIDNFWIAYDSIQTTTDSLMQIDFIQKLYIDKGTKGLRSFMVLRDIQQNCGYN